MKVWDDDFLPNLRRSITLKGAKPVTCPSMREELRLMCTKADVDILLPISTKSHYFVEKRIFLHKN